MSRMPTRLVVAVAIAAVALAGCTSTTSTSELVTSPNGTPASTANGTTSSGTTSTSGATVGSTPTAGSTRGVPTGKQTTVPTPIVSQVGTVKAAFADVKLGAISVDPKLNTPTAMITITNHSSTRSNYIVDLSIMSANGKVQLDASMVAAPGLAPGHTAKRKAKFMTTTKLPAGAKLTIVGVARLAS